MNRYEAIQKFFEGFNVPAYAESAVPAQAKFPYLTYNLVDGDFMSGEVAMNVNLWFYTDSEAKPNALAAELARAIGYGGRLLTFEGGAVWLKKGSPWCQNVPDDSGDEKVKHRYLNVDLEFLTME